MTITGKYNVDNNFITVFENDTYYCLPRNNHSTWGSAKVGERISRAMYDRYESECTQTGTFELSDAGWCRA